jgi:serine/threonine protein kinase
MPSGQPPTSQDAERRIPDLRAGRSILLEDDEEACDEALPAIEGYAIERLLGEGAAGEVYVAEQASTGRRVALKLLRQRLGACPEAARIWRELEIIGQLRVPCLPRLLDYGEWEGLSTS